MWLISFYSGYGPRPLGTQVQAPSWFNTGNNTKALGVGIRPCSAPRSNFTHKPALNLLVQTQRHENSSVLGIPPCNATPTRFLSIWGGIYKWLISGLRALTEFKTRRRALNSSLKGRLCLLRRYLVSETLSLRRSVQFRFLAFNKWNSLEFPRH